VKCNSCGYYKSTDINKKKRSVVSYFEIGENDCPSFAKQNIRSDVQDSATVIGEDTQNISRVTNSDNESHVSAQIQGMLADVLSILTSIQSQKHTQKNEELGAKLMAENGKMADRLTEQWPGIA